MGTITVKHCGLLDYKEWQNQQREFVRLRQAEVCEDTLFLVEHPPVFTLGRNTNIAEDLPANYSCYTGSLNGIPVVRTERGGGVMFHNPGQLVAYPIIKLKGKIRNIRRFMWLVEEAIIQALAGVGVCGFRQPEIHPGVWTVKGKIGFIGIAIQRSVVYYGFAVNVANDLEPFQWIATCGLRNSRITSVQEMLGAKVAFIKFQEILAERFKKLWNETIVSLV